MIGLRVGPKAGVRAGIAAGMSLDPVSPSSGGAMAGVSRDATSLIFGPASSGEWTTTMSAAALASGNPTSTWLAQEASGNLADSLAAANTLTVGGASWAYRQAVPGWSRLAVTVPDASANHNAQNTTTVPDVATTSVLLLLYVNMPTVAPGGNRRISRLDSTAGAIAGISSIPAVQCVTQGTGGTTANGASSPLNAVRPVVLAVNKTAASAAVYTDQDKIIGTAGTYSGLAVGVGSSNGTTPAMGLLYAAMFSGAAAELTAAQIKTLLQILGWTILWT